MNPLPTKRTVAIAAAAILFLSCGSLASAAVLESIAVDPPIVHLRPCEVVLLEITGHYDDGTARDLQLEFGLTFRTAENFARRAGTNTIVDNFGLDDTLTVSLDGVDSAPVPIVVVSPEDGSLCPFGQVLDPPADDGPGEEPGGAPGDEPSEDPGAEPGSDPGNAPGQDPGGEPEEEPGDAGPDAACQFCIHDRVTHRFRIEGHPVFGGEQLLQDRCAAVEFPRPVFRVAADGTPSSVLDGLQGVGRPCQTALTAPEPHILDATRRPLSSPDPAVFGTVVAVDRRPGFVRFEYPHPPAPPAD